MSTDTVAENPAETTETVSAVPGARMVFNVKELRQAMLHCGKLAARGMCRFGQEWQRQAVITSHADRRVTMNLRTTDWEIAIPLRQVDVLVGGSLVLILPAHKQVIDKCEDDVVTLYDNGENLEVIESCGTTMLSRSDREDREPMKIESWEVDQSAVVSAEDYYRLVKGTAIAVDAESSRFRLGGTLHEVSKGVLTLVSTDTRRLSVQLASAKTYVNEDFDQHKERKKAIQDTPEDTVCEVAQNFVIPPKPMAVAADIADGEVWLWFGKNAMTIRTNGVEIVTRMIAGRFPRYQDAIPSGFKWEAMFVAGDMVKAMTKMLAASTEESRAVDFQFNGESLSLLCNGSTHQMRLASEAAKGVTITLDPRYVLDYCKTIDKRELVTLKVIDAESAVQFSHGLSLYVVIPLSRNR